MSVPRAGPELPPHLLARRKRQAETTSIEPERRTTEKTKDKIEESDPPSPSKRRRVIGPAPPPAPLDQKPLNDPVNESSDEDDFGPSLPAPGSHMSISSSEAAGSARQVSSTASDAQRNKSTRRDDWMTMPPKQDDLAARMDPTKIKAKGFNTGKGARGPSQAGGVDNATWTETPEEKRKRLENEVLGIAPLSTNLQDGVHTLKKSKENEDKARQIQEYNEKHRSKSLFQQHQGSARKREEDDPSKRVFDYEKDMAAGSKIGHTQRKELLNKASDFGSRFSKGNYL